MELMQLIRKRRSVRAYADKPVEREKLEALAEAVRLAPSACNSQPWRVVFVDEPELRDRIARATFTGVVNFNRFTVGARAFAVLVMEKPRLTAAIGGFLKRRDFPLLDVGIAAAQLCLRAAELGLGTCMLGWFDERKVKKLLGIPGGTRVALLVSIGYPATDAPVREKQRKATADIRSFNAY